MTGHRRTRRRGPRGRAIRLGRRIEQLRHEAMAAPTAESQLAAAFDYFRMIAKHNPDAGVMHELAASLMAAGSRLEPGAVAAGNAREASAKAHHAYRATRVRAGGAGSPRWAS